MAQTELICSEEVVHLLADVTWIDILLSLFNDILDFEVLLT